MKIKIMLLVFVMWNAVSYCVSEAQPTFRIFWKEAVMPVEVRGNVGSDVLIVFLHGGPGGTAMKKIGSRAFNELEKQFGVVYWDQRGGDGSQGGTDKKFMQLNQFVEDLDILIESLHLRYPNASVFLMGHCWGGGLATAYLLDPKRQAKVAGWIDVAGAHNNPKGDSLSVAWVKNYARQMIANQTDTRYWKKALAWYDENLPVRSDQLRHYQFVRKAHGYQRIEGDSLGVYPGYTHHDLFVSPVSYVGYYLNYYSTLSSFIISDIDLTSAMHSITVPTLILWGKRDGLIPVAMAKEAYDAIGTSTNQKELVLFDDTAHMIFYEQPVLFVKCVSEFVRREKLRTVSAGTVRLRASPKSFGQAAASSEL